MAESFSRRTLVVPMAILLSTLVCTYVQNLKSELGGVLYCVKPVGGANDRFWMWNVGNMTISYIFRQSKCAARNFWILGYGKAPKKAVETRKIIKEARKNNPLNYNRDFARHISARSLITAGQTFEITVRSSFSSDRKCVDGLDTFSASTKF